MLNKILLNKETYNSKRIFLIIYLKDFDSTVWTKTMTGVIDNLIPGY